MGTQGQGGDREQDEAEGGMAARLPGRRHETIPGIIHRIALVPGDAAGAAVHSEANTVSATRTVVAMSSGVWAVDRNPASNCDGAR